MVDINKWYSCKNESPKKRGKYKLMIGVRNPIGGWLEIGIIIIDWNGRVWNLPNEYVAVKWTYLKPEDSDKYLKIEEVFGGKL